MEKTPNKAADGVVVMDDCCSKKRRKNRIFALHNSLGWLSDSNNEHDIARENAVDLYRQLFGRERANKVSDVVVFVKTTSTGPSIDPLCVFEGSLQIGGSIILNVKLLLGKVREIMESRKDLSEADICEAEILMGQAKTYSRAAAVMVLDTKQNLAKIKKRLPESKGSL